MNKFVLLLGVIVLVTLAIMFFCVGFFTGSTISTSDIVSMAQKETPNGKLDQKITAKGIGEITDAKSLTISDKILGILNAAGCATETFANVVQGNKASSKRVEKNKTQNNTLTIDSLLREIAISHNINDDCSYEKTRHIIDNNYPITDRNLFGKKIVFIGYFKNDIAAQIQALLITKGYKVHVERSKSWDADESFVFCGPFENEKNANKLVEWLKEHDFSDARVIDIVKEVKEDTLLDTIKDNSDNMPANEESIPQHEALINHKATVNSENVQHLANHVADFGNHTANIIPNNHNLNGMNGETHDAPLVGQSAGGFDTNIQNSGNAADMTVNNMQQQIFPVAHDGNQPSIIGQQINHTPQNHIVGDQPYNIVTPDGAFPSKSIQTTQPQENVNMPGHDNISVPQM